MDNNKASPAQVSEGTESARNILRDVQLADLQLDTYIYPRTLEEAFGAGERGPITDPDAMHPSDKLVVKAGGLGLAALAVMSATGVLQ
ncbi:MAG: hypothetical protein Q8S92_22890 [Hydrogenophaga sp.]|uniref:hypothetical protein n=1 Tax=Hydrogenophaga sp. TaxID=1904254 RepID=UPI002732B5B0|nr:hypothetical protein [Hydrogenophaga sp.]MDP3351842.1 hypothetical protein [Hydrogenophaga sp.]